MLAAEGAVHWTTVATLLGDGAESCIDGRSGEPVLGTPGGDVGEILLGLGALERVTGRQVRLLTVDALFEAYGESFGRISMHTDEEALLRLRASLRSDPSFSGVLGKLRDDVPLEELHSFVSEPPPALRAALLEHLLRPEHIGCSHLRLTLTEPERYGVRPALVRAVLRAAFALGHRHPHALDYALLRGAHTERGILEVDVDHDVHAHSRVPMIRPQEAGREWFVHHPGVAAFLRLENGTFFLEQANTLVGEVPAEETYLRVLDTLAERQLLATVEHLARGLPRVHVVAHADHTFTVVPEGTQAPVSSPSTLRLAFPTQSAAQH